MRDLYSDDYDSVVGDEPERLIPSSVRKLAGAALFLGVIGMMGLWSYRLGTRDAGEVPIVRAMEGPTRIEPEDPGGLTAAHQGLEVNSVLAGQPDAAPVVAAPARPAPTVLTEEDGPQGELIAAAPVLAPDAGADLPMPDEDPLSGGTASDLQTELAAMVEAVVPAAVEAAPADADQRPKGRPSNLAVARAPAPAVAPARTAEQAPARKAEPAANEVSALGPGTRLIQLGAYDSEEIARQAWARLVRGQGDLLGSKSLYIERTTSNARVFYRLRVAGFQDTEQTRAMCEALRARGVDCIPVTLR